MHIIMIKVYLTFFVVFLIKNMGKNSYNYKFQKRECYFSLIMGNFLVLKFGSYKEIL
jgi:hypothetical protein